MKKFSILALICWASTTAQAQDTTRTRRPLRDSVPVGSGQSRTNQEALFNRPFVVQGGAGRSTAAIGGYMEANTNYFVTDGVGEGFSMELRRFNLFIYSTILPRIKFISELEFEHGTKEISLETALVDFQIHPYFVFRGGIILPPIGYFNQNHDSPKWEFVDRPLVSTTILPATLSEVGFGIYGRIPRLKYVFTYEAYLVNGLRDGIVANAANRTSLQSGKSEEMFAQDNNGIPSMTGRLAVRRRNAGEVGLSYYGGIYNTFESGGLVMDSKRRLNVMAIDYNFNVFKLQVIGEAALVHVNVPSSLGQQFGSRQWGFHTDLIYPVWRTNLWTWKNVVLNTNARIERVDYNLGAFADEGYNVADDITAVVPGISLRFSTNTVMRVNYRYHWRRDLLGNPTSRTAGFQFGFATYF